MDFPRVEDVCQCMAILIIYSENVLFLQEKKSFLLLDIGQIKL